MLVVVTIDIDSNWPLTAVDVNYVTVRAIERQLVVFRVVVGLKLKFLSVCYWILTRNSIVVVVRVAVVVVVEAEVAVMDSDNLRWLCQYCKPMTVVSRLVHFYFDPNISSKIFSVAMWKVHRRNDDSTDAIDCILWTLLQHWAAVLSSNADSVSDLEEYSYPIPNFRHSDRRVAE